MSASGSDIQNLIHGLNLEVESDMNEALNRTNCDDALLFDMMMHLLGVSENCRQLALDAFGTICFFFTDSKHEGLASMAKDAAEVFEGTAFKAQLLASCDHNLIGVELSNKSKTQFAIFLNDASEPGRVRFSLFDASGFFDHHTTDSYKEALNEAWLRGFTVQTAGTLESICMTEKWAKGSRRTAQIQALNSGKISYKGFFESAA